MKRTFIIFLIINLFFALSCEVDIKPVEATEEDVFNKREDFNSAVLATYARMTDIFNALANVSLHYFEFIPGDDLTKDQNSFDTFDNLVPTDPSLDKYWNGFYQMIYRSNLVLEKIDENGSVLSQDDINVFRGEVLFLRAWAYFNIWTHWQNAPLILQRTTSASIINAPAEGLEILDQAIVDFQEAANLLPASWPSSNVGRATQNSANGYLGKALMFRGDYGGGATDYSSAVTAFDKISGVSLVENFIDNFDASTENNSESIFEFQAGQNAANNCWLSNDFTSASVSCVNSYWGFFSDDPGENWVHGGNYYRPTDKLIAAFEDGDPRKDMTLDLSTEGVPRIRKYLDTGSNGKINTLAYSNNYRLLRLAEVLLLRAEAIVKSGGAASSAIDLINQVRARARGAGTIPADYANTETNTATILEWIRNERFVELAAEGSIRWLDLKRWHMAGDINLTSGFDFSNIDGPGSSQFDISTHLLFPIPQSEINSNPEISQNPGY